MAETFPEYLDRWLRNTTAYGATNPLVKMPVKRFRALSAQEFASISNGGVLALGTTNDPIARNLLKNYETLIRERGEHAGFLGFGMVDMVIAAAADGRAKDALLPVCLKKATFAKGGEIIRAKIEGDEEWVVNPLLSAVLPELPGRDFARQAKIPQSFVPWLRAQLGNRVRTVKEDGFVGLFSSQQMVIQARFKDSRVRQSLARNPAIRAKIDGQVEASELKGETTDEGIEDLGMVLPCDDSQLRVVQRVNFGNSLIVEGPPGTGKSQTITNIIGNALWRGKNVLFVCEKRTAVSQVEERLVDSGLSGALLNLHDEDLDKAEFLEQATSPILAASDKSTGLRPQMDELVEIRRSLNDRVRNGRKPSHASLLVENRQALAGLIRLRRELGDVPKLTIDNWQSLSRERLNKLLNVIGSWEGLAPVLADGESVWNELRTEAFDGLPNAARECEKWAQEALSTLAKAEEIREQNVVVGLEDLLTSRQVVESALTLAQLVLKRPSCHAVVIGNAEVSSLELATLRAASARQEEIKARRYPVILGNLVSDGLRQEAAALLPEENSRSWEDLAERKDQHLDQAQHIESLERDYAQFSRQIGLIPSPESKIRMGQLRAVIELADTGCYLPRSWWNAAQTPLLGVGGWKKQVNECLSHVQAAPHPIHFSALDGVASTHWVHVEAMAENSFNLVSYCLRFVNDRKCKFALKQIYPAVAGAKSGEWERLAVHAMAAKRMAQSLVEAGKIHPVLTTITADYLATAHKGDAVEQQEDVSRVERAAAIVEKWRARNDWFEIESPHWQTAWETTNPRLLTEAKRLLAGHESLRFFGKTDAVEELAQSHRARAARIDRFIKEARTAHGDGAVSVEESFAAQAEFSRCGEELRALEKYRPLVSNGNIEAQWDTLDAIIRWRDEFEAVRASRRLDLDNRDWINVERRLREYAAAIEKIEQTTAYYFSVDPETDAPDLRALSELLLDVLNGLPAQPLWLEKKRWSLRMSAFPELKTLWGKLTTGAVIPKHGHRLFCFNLLLNCSPDSEPNGAELTQALKAFKEKDELLASWSVNELKQRLQTRFEDARVDYAVEYGRLCALLNMQRRPAVRQMVNNVEKYRFADYLLAAKPCWMMSPVALANLLDSEVFEEHGVPFDVVVFDEASQIPVVNGLLAMAFGKQTVIVGDTKQLPPTNFFRTFGAEGGEDDDYGISESLLNEFSGAVPNEMLCSHYRSETPDLIRFSNDWFYRGKLEFYPPAKVSGIGRRLVYVPEGIFSEVAGQRNNPAEARMVVKLIEEHVAEASERSLGVVTMNIPQMELVEELLLRSGAAVRAFCADDKKFFLRNLETVQGDEMDRIILSLTYGRNADGRFNAAILGPLTKSGGERRLNVAITRSRQGMIVVSSLTSALMGTSGAQSEGFLCLKAFIEDLERSTASRDFGLNGRRFQRRNDGVSNVVFCESPFEESVVEFLEQEGYEIVCQYGSGEFRIDIVVRENERNLLAIECDGKAYHSSLVARTRDRAREFILRQRGWRVHRVWSTNWWNFEEQEKQAIRDAIASARAILKNQPRQNGSVNGSGIRFVSRSEVPRDPDVSSTAGVDDFMLS